MTSVVAAARRAAITLALVVGAGVVAVEPAAPAAGAPSVEPPGVITLVEDGAWSWFEDARATFDARGSTLLVSGVAGSDAEAVAPGTVVLAQIDIATGARSLVDLGRAEVDDHNSASIDAGPAGEVLTSWSRHHADRLVHHQRRRTDGSWLRLPPTEIGARATYANLRRAADAEGNPILYDFVRGDRFDPIALASADEGRTWVNLGPVLRDPNDGSNVRPYVQYAEPHDGRIHLVATEAHPDQSATSIYHGYIEGGHVHDSAGKDLGAVGVGVPVTTLTRVWQASTDERGWSTDISVDPATGRPVIAFSVTRSFDDHRYRYAHQQGLEWTTEEMAHAGTALLPSQEHYTGLAAIDPTDPDRVVVSTDVHPEDGTALVSPSDGRAHWELWDGHRGPGGQWTWTAITADSAQDNLRPVLVSHPTGASALVWLRGHYPSYADYQLAVVGLVRRPDGSLVPGALPTSTPAVDTRPYAAPTATTARPVVGSFDGHRADDVYLARAGSARDDLLLGDEQRHPTPIDARSVFSSAVPIAGDYDADGRTDIFWYVAGSGVETVWQTTGIGSFTPRSTRQVNGSYIPVPGDLDGDDDTDILWYAPGSGADHLWTATATGFSSAPARPVNGTYLPVPGDYDGDDDTDILWYAPGSGADHLWTATATGFSSAPSRPVNGTYLPVPGDYDGDDDTDILWYAPGSGADHLWTATATGFSSAPARPVNGTYLPIAGDLDGDGADDVHWYAPGTPTDHLWWSAHGPLASSEAAAANL